MSLQRVCLVHYHEIGLKGHNRSTFEKRLASNLKALLSGCPITGIRRISGRLCIFIEESASYEDACAVADRIAGVPGIARVSCGSRSARLRTFHHLQGFLQAQPYQLGNPLYGDDQAHRRRALP